MGDNQSIESNPELTQILELADKTLKVMITISYVQKLNTEMKDLKKETNWISNVACFSINPYVIFTKSM